MSISREGSGAILIPSISPIYEPLSPNGYKKEDYRSISQPRVIASKTEASDSKDNTILLNKNRYPIDKNGLKIRKWREEFEERLAR